MRYRKRAATILLVGVLLTVYAGSSARGQGLSPADIYAKYAPAVVSINTFNGSGSGFVIDKKGTVLTNYHVVRSDEFVMVSIRGERYVGRSVALSPSSDLALIALPDGDYPAVYLARSSNVRVGEDVVALGDPLGFEASLSVGVVSGRRRVERLGEVLQITAPVSPGSSGGPLFDRRGHVVGVVTASRRDGQNINFAVPVERAHELMSRFAGEGGERDGTAVHSESSSPNGSTYYLGRATTPEKAWVAPAITGWQVIRHSSCDPNTSTGRSELDKATRLFRASIEEVPPLSSRAVVSVFDFRVPGRGYTIYNEEYEIGGYHHPYWGLALAYACAGEEQQLLNSLGDAKAAGVWVYDRGFFSHSRDLRSTYWNPVKGNERILDAVEQLWGRRARAFAAQ